VAQLAPPPTRRRQGSTIRTRRSRRRRGGRRLLFGLALAVVACCGAAAAVYELSGVRLTGDASALARLERDWFAGSIESVRAAGPGAAPIPLGIDGVRLTPERRLTPGETVTVTVVVRRPAWSRWALGATRRETLTVQAPVAHVVQRWVTAAKGSKPYVRFDLPVDRASIGGRPATGRGARVAIPTSAAAGSVSVAAAPRTWETLGPPTRVTWFPRTTAPAVLVQPAPGTQVSPRTPVRLTFARPVDDVLGGALPRVPGVAGTWHRLDDHTLRFDPSGFGAPFASDLSVRLPAKAAVATASASAVRTETSVRWPVAPASFLRLQQLLAQAGYLPLEWAPAGDDVPHSLRAQLSAATSAPAGTFHWRYPNTPHELVSLWSTGKPNEITRGAVMMFQDEHHLAVDGIAGPQVWHALLKDTVAGVRRTDGYSYVYVHRNVPQLLTLWHDGRVVLTSPGNTGVPAAPTQLGTWPVFEHIPVGRMSGTNPDGTHYDDPGIRWISYFHGGEALHAFNRASFGTPQSLGCVELPLDAAAKVWPYTPIGTLVTIEN
jgi:hypothetical protein